jgi:ABC-type lipoprotein release transport system permease subunit
MHAIFFWKFYSINQIMRSNNFNNKEKVYVLVCKLSAGSSLVNILRKNQYLLSDFEVPTNSFFVILMLIFLICFV